DAAAGIETWERHDEVAARSTLVVVERPGWRSILPEGFEWVRVEVPHLEVSSTDLRARVVDGRPLDYLLPPAVIDGIRDRQLYGAPVWGAGRPPRRRGQPRPGRPPPPPRPPPIPRRAGPPAMGRPAAGAPRCAHTACAPRSWPWCWRPWW